MCVCVYETTESECHWFTKRIRTVNICVHHSTTMSLEWQRSNVSSPKHSAEPSVEWLWKDFKSTLNDIDIAMRAERLHGKSWRYAQFTQCFRIVTSRGLYHRLSTKLCIDSLYGSSHCALHALKCGVYAKNELIQYHLSQIWMQFNRLDLTAAEKKLRNASLETQFNSVSRAIFTRFSVSLSPPFPVFFYRNAFHLDEIHACTYSCGLALRGYWQKKRITAKNHRVSWKYSMEISLISSIWWEKQSKNYNFISQSI